MRGARWWTVIAVLVVMGWVGNAGAEESERGRDGSSAQEKAPAAKQARAERHGDRVRRKSRPPAMTHRVARVIDGDTVELGNGQDVRLVGIDTPEVGECGFEKAAATLTHLVEGQRVRLTRSDEDRDRYGRLLRYVDAGGADAGLRLIRKGLAIARYDSRDGYGYHRREPAYIAADRARGIVRCAAPAPAPVSAPRGGGCAPGYSPCVPPSPPDVDCGDVDGPVRVTGSDPHALDGDGDGIACE